MSGVIKPKRTILSRNGAQTALDDESWREFLFGHQIILSRGLCAFNRLRLDPKLSRVQQRQAAELKAMANAPFDEVGLYIVIDGDVAHAWSWDKAFVEQATGLPSRLCVPETVLHPLADGVVLRACIDGFEAQAWSDGLLQQSRWWPHEPSARDWQLFLSGLDERLQTDNAAPPAMVPVDLDAATTRQSNRRPLLSTLKALEPKSWAMLAAWIVLPVLAFHLISLLFIAQQKASLERDIAVLQEELGPKRLAATRLGQVQRDLRVYSDRLNAAPPLPGLAAVLSQVASVNGQVQSVSLVDSDLAVNFQTDDPINQVDWVRLLEADAALSAVRVFPTVQRNVWSVEAGLIDANTLQMALSETDGEGVP